MADLFEAVIYFANGGMNAAVHPSLLNKDNVARMTNCRTEDNLPTTRYGIRFFPLDGQIENFVKDNLQGGCFYNPSLGQSSLTFGVNEDTLVIAAGGRKYQVFVNDASQIMEVSEITSGLLTDTDVYMAHLIQAENYLIAQDGISDCFIFPGEGNAFFSPGYNTQNKDASRLANGASLGCYAHGRIIQVVDGNRFLVGDIIFANNLTTPRDILNTSEQLYFASGANFAAPSDMGECRAIDFLPLRNTLYGHADVMCHQKIGVMSLDVSQYPRTNWENEVLTSIALLDTAAAGMYALALNNGDQIFRSRVGIQSLRSAAANDELFGNPQSPVSEPVQCWFDLDVERLIRFTSCAQWDTQNRFFSTVGQWAQSRWRGADGMVVLNFMPLGEVQPQNWAWEGLWTLPPGHESVVQIINGVFREQDRTFLIGTTRQGEYNFETGDLGFKNFIAEIDPLLPYDVLEDGTKVPISAQCVSREFSGPDRTLVKEIMNGAVSFRGVVGDLTWGVWVRKDSTGDWTFYRGGKSKQCDSVTVTGEPCGLDPACACFVETQPREVVVEIGACPIQRARAWQFLVRWKGYAQLEYLRVSYQNADPEAGSTILPSPSCSGRKTQCGDYDDFEYSNPNNRWEALIDA
jgi:hypothetical protein